MLPFDFMKITKLLTFLLIFNININSNEGIDEYKIEIIIFKYLNTNSNEDFNTELEIPNESIIKFYNPDLYINKTALNNFSKTTSFFSNLFSNINPIYSSSESSDSINKDYNPNPKNWFRESKDFNTLKEIKKKIIDDNNVILIDSKAWVQGIDDFDSSKYLYSEDKNNDYGFYLKLYKKRYMHAEIKAFIGINNKKLKIKPIESHIKDLEKKIYTTKIIAQDYDLNLNYPNDIENINIVNPKRPEEVISNTDLNIYIDEEKRIFNNEIHLFEHPMFGILLSVNKI